jgi:hypothetical protein
MIKRASKNVWIVEKPMLIFRDGVGVFGRAPALKKYLQSCRSTKLHRGAAPRWISDLVKCLAQLQIYHHPYDI